MHAVLCFSATHLLHINPSQVYEEAIGVHKHYALSLLRSKLDSISDPCHMNDGIYPTAILLSLQSMATFKSHSSHPTDLDWIPLIVGFKSIIALMWEDRAQSISHPVLLAYKPPPDKGASVQQRISQKFNLVSVASQLPPAYSEQIIGLASILNQLFPNDFYASRPLSSVSHTLSASSLPFRPVPVQILHQVLAWTSTLPGSFVPRAIEGDPAILIVLGWMFALFTWGRGYCEAIIGLAEHV